jgi:hypothetical protein
MRSAENRSRRRTWIFQAVPRYFDLTEALKHIRIFSWRVKQHKKKIHAGDDLFLWLAGRDGGMVARGTIITDPQTMEDAPEELQFVKDMEKEEEEEEGRLQAAIEIDTVFVDPVKRAILKSHAVLSSIALLKQTRGTNFPLTGNQAKALNTLCPHAKPQRVSLAEQELAEKMLRDIDDQIQVNIEIASTKNPTEKEQLVKSRIGQGLFRQRIQLLESACRVSRVSDPQYLVASHIKPWRACNNNERLDGANGLFLSPNIDLLFDRGHISFDDDGTLLVAAGLDTKTLEALGVPVKRTKCGEFSANQRKYLAYHRRHIFRRIEVESE